MRTARCVACETSHMVTLLDGDSWCVWCLTEGKRDAYLEASALVAAIVASRARHTHDVKAGSR